MSPGQFMHPPPTPDPPPRIRFKAEDRSHRLRIAVGSRLVTGVGSIVFWFLVRTASQRLIHVGKRIRARSVTALLRLKLDITGVESIGPGRRYILVALHEGFADAVALLRLPLPLRFLVRHELFDWVALGRYLRATEPVRGEGLGGPPAPFSS